MNETFRIIQHQLVLVTEARDKAQLVLMERKEAVRVWQAVFNVVRGCTGLSDGVELTSIEHPSDGSAIIYKPVKLMDETKNWREKLPVGTGYWKPECSGRLVSGTGCGHCLRCNREWYALKRGPHEFVNGRDDAICLDVAIVVGLLKFGNGERIEQLRDLPIPTEIPYTEIDERVALERWCNEWNEASRKGNRQQMTVLETYLRKMKFPPNVELSCEHVSAEFPHGRQVIVDVTPAETTQGSKLGRT